MTLGRKTKIIEMNTIVIQTVVQTIGIIRIVKTVIIRTKEQAEEAIILPGIVMNIQRQEVGEKDRPMAVHLVVMSVVLVLWTAMKIVKQTAEAQDLHVTVHHHVIVDAAVHLLVLLPVMMVVAMAARIRAKETG